MMLTGGIEDDDGKNSPLALADDAAGGGLCDAAPVGADAASAAAGEDPGGVADASADCDHSAA